MIKNSAHTKLLLLGLFLTSTLAAHNHKPISTYYTYEPPSTTETFTSGQVSRLQFGAIALWYGSMVAGVTTLGTISSITQNGFTEDRVGYLILSVYACAILGGLSTHCFNKAERMS